MDKTCRITISIPGDNRHVSPDVILGDLARKLRGIDLSSGVHELIIFGDGSVALGAALVWEPAKAPPAPQQPKRKAG